jgi:N-acetylglutamate synthase-like GNAT family acetyltransferase
MNNYQFRDAGLHDLQEINHLLRISKAYWGYDEKFLDSFMVKLGITEDYINKNNIQLFFLDNRLVAFYNFVSNHLELELDNLFIHPDFIGKGSGRQLWKKCCKAAKSMGYYEFTIWSDPNAENFYLKMGCKKVGVRQSPLMPGRFPPVLKYKLEK